MNGGVDERKDGQMNGWKDEWNEERTDGRTDGWMDREVCNRWKRENGWIYKTLSATGSIAKMNVTQPVFSGQGERSQSHR